MRIPPYYNDPAWQRFFAGFIIGALIGFAIFVYLNGINQERQLKIIAQQKKQITTLEDHLNTLREEEDQQNKELEKKLTIQSITIKIDKSPKVTLDGIKELDIKEKIYKQLSTLIGDDVSSVSNNRELIFNAVNNQPFLIEDKIYYAKVKSVTIYSELLIHIIIDKEQIR